MRTSLLALLCWALALVAIIAPAGAQVAVPPLSGRVVDQTRTLTPEATARLEQTLKAFEARKGSQIAVLLVPSVQPETIEQFSLRVAEAWKIGRKKIDDGALLVIAKNDRKLRIEVGYGLEGALNDVTAKRIIDEIITPKFKNSDFSGGVEDGVARMISVIDGEPLPVPKPQYEWQDGIDLDGAIPLLFGALVLTSILQTLLGRLPAALITGGAVGVAAWWLMHSVLAGVIGGVLAFVVGLIVDMTNATSRGGRRVGGSSGWSGGSSSSDGSSSSSSSDGGFSGGGGDFGGGGASGSW